MTAPDWVGVDIGGTTIRAALVGVGGAVEHRREAPTPQIAAEAETVIVRLVTDCAAAASGRVAGVGLAVAGFLSADTQRIMFAPHLAWRDAPLAARIAGRVSLPVVMDHDVNCAAWAEATLGAAAGARVGLVMAVGTGIGAGLVVDGSLYRGAFGVAPELGHVVVVPDGRPCSCGKRGCLERYASGTALAQTVIERVATGEPTALADAAEHDGVPLTGRAVAEAARIGDAVAADAVADLGRWLGRGVAMACDVLDPEVVVIGGGVSQSAELFLDVARTELAERITGGRYRPIPRMVAARFGADASMVGAALMAARRLG